MEKRDEMIGTLRAALNVIESSGGLREEDVGKFEGLMRSAEMIVDEATIIALKKDVPRPPPSIVGGRKRSREPVEQRRLFAPADDDFIVHARDLFPEGKAIGRGIVEQIGNNLICRVPLYGPDGQLLLAANSVIVDYDFDPDTSRATFRINDATCIVCALELVVSPMMAVRSCGNISK